MKHFFYHASLIGSHLLVCKYLYNRFINVFFIKGFSCPNIPGKNIIHDSVTFLIDTLKLVLLNVTTNLQFTMISKGYFISVKILRVRSDTENDTN